jgi:DUF4097 and DUF4098 domain-containing protein YvlB
VKSTSGDVEIRDCSASCVSVECTSGDADITCHSPTIEVTTTSGDIEIENDEPINSVICRTSSGDIDCRLYNTDYSASLKSGSGSIRNKTRLPEDKITKKEMLVGEGKGEVILSTVSGNIKLFD